MPSVPSRACFERSVPLLFGVIALLSGACTGDLERPGSQSAQQPGSAAAGGAGGGATLDTPSSAPARLRRLTRSQYAKSVSRLLGDQLTLPDDLAPDVAIAGYFSVGASTLGIAERSVERFEDAALALAAQAVTSPEALQRLLPCPAQPAPSVACLEQFVGSFGRRAFRRPLSQDELTRYVSLGTQAGSAVGGASATAEAVLAAMLQSPLFLYRREFGLPTMGAGAARVLDAYELASRLSFFLEDALPDDVLLESAASGGLASDAGLQLQAERLLDSGFARESLKGYMAETLHLSNLDDLPHVASLFPLLTPSLGASMRSEALLAFERVVFEEDHDFLDLLDTRQTFVNAELARLYGLPKPAIASATAFVPVLLPDDGRRRGLLGQAAFLAGSSHASSASATRRGQFIRETLLCQTIPPPPPNVSLSLPEDSAATGPRTARQRLEVHQYNPSCVACHSLMDPLGLALEHFDALGVWRDDDAGLPLETASELDGVAFGSLPELAGVLRQRPEVSACVTRNLFRFALGREEAPDEAPLLAGLTEAFAQSGHRFRSLALALVLSPDFRRAGEPK